MAVIEIQQFLQVLDTFPLEEVNHIKVIRAAEFNPQKVAQYHAPHYPCYYDHLGNVPKSSRILEVCCRNPETNQWHRHWYNADTAIVVPRV